jgi:hypothetical protein
VDPHHGLPEVARLRATACHWEISRDFVPQATTNGAQQQITTDKCGPRSAGLLLVIAGPATGLDAPSKLMTPVRSRSAALLVIAGHAYCDEFGGPSLTAFIPRISRAPCTCDLGESAERLCDRHIPVIDTY